MPTWWFLFPSVLALVGNICGGSSLLIEGTLFSQGEDEAVSRGRGKNWGLSPYSAGLPCQREEAAGSCGIGYITSTNGPSELFPLSPVSSMAASNGLVEGVAGTHPPADHMCLECADVSFGAPAGPYIPPTPTSRLRSWHLGHSTQLRKKPRLLSSWSGL